MAAAAAVMMATETVSVSLPMLAQAKRKMNGCWTWREGRNEEIKRGKEPDCGKKR